MKKIYVIRHCESKGQPPKANLTENGIKQAELLKEFFDGIDVDTIITSPFRRAVQSIIPLATNKGIEIELDDRLKERVLSTENLTDWQSKLEASYVDIDLKLPGGESSREAINRIRSIVEEIYLGENQRLFSKTLLLFYIN